jgi:signal transduction histidine kinase
MININFSEINFFRNRKKKKMPQCNFQKLFEHFPYITEVFDIDGNRLFTNRVATELISTGNHSLLYNILSEAKLKSPEIYDHLLKVSVGETAVFQSTEDESGLFDWYQAESLFEITAYPVNNDQGQPKYFIIIHREIQQKNLDEEYQAEDFRKLERHIAHSILTNISHELRTPLNWIIGFSELINNEKNIERIKEFNRTIKRGGDLLLTQIEKLIEMSAILKNTDEIEKSKFQINQVLLELYGLIKNEIESLNKDITLQVKCELSDDNSEITTDKLKLRQILINLLHNSVKFTKQGQIELGVFLTHENEFLFYVKDTGIGMDKTKQKYIFEIFRKGEGEDFNEQYGLGLGLSITSHYVKNLGGEIWVDSEIGQGSTFCFTVKDFTEELKAEQAFKLQ